MTTKRVLVTGAAGYIAGQLLPALRERYHLRLIDRAATNRAGQTVEGVELADLSTATDDELAAYFADVDAVVHTAYARPAGEGVKAQYEAERATIDLMQRVYQLCSDNGVRRLVVASTNQASKWYENPYFEGRIDRVDPFDYPRPDSFYGWAKAAYESLGFLYASGSLGRPLEVVHIRIVAPRPIDRAAFAGQPRHRYLRDLAGYVSERDLQQLFCRSIDTDDITDRFGVPFQIFYGVSANARTFWSITNARDVVGYEPEDDSETLFNDGSV